MLTKKFFCPVNGWDCPYWKKDGSCTIGADGDDPWMVCDDASVFWDEGDYPYVWEDENGNRYDAQELLERGYHFLNGEPHFSPTAEQLAAYEKELEHAPRWVNTSGIGPT